MSWRARRTIGEVVSQLACLLTHTLSCLFTVSADEKVSTELKKQITQARTAKKLTQSQLAQVGGRNSRRQRVGWAAAHLLHCLVTACQTNLYAAMCSGCWHQRLSVPPLLTRVLVFAVIAVALLHVCCLCQLCMFVASANSRRS